MEHKKKVLVVEDHDDIREMTADLLTISGYLVQTAENGKLAVEMATSFPPDIVVCDIMMPVLDGYGVLLAFRQSKKLKTIPFIFLTAKSEKSDFRKGMDLGADDFLTKPFEEVELLTAIESRLKRKDELVGNKENLFETFYDESRAIEELQQLSNDRKVTHVKKKQIVYFEGDLPYKFYYLKKGKIKAYRTTDQGKAFTTTLYTAGDFFGYVAILDQSDYFETTETLEDSEIVSIPKQDFLDLIFKNNVVANKFIKLMAKDILEKEELLKNMAYSSLKKRIATTLVILKNKFQIPNQPIFSLKISRDDLAAMVGTATESTIRVLSEFKEEGLLEIKGSEIKILDEKRLTAHKN